MANRWVALALILLLSIQFTQNWFCIIPAFGSIAAATRLSSGQIGLVVGIFIAGYGVAHIHRIRRRAHPRRVDRGTLRPARGDPLRHRVG